MNRPRLSSARVILALMLLSVVLADSTQPLENNTMITSQLETPSLVFPRNITDLYQGTWSISTNTSNPIYIGFTKRGGSTMFAMTNSEYTKDVDHVQGEMILRNGIYSTDDAIAYFLNGVYFWQTGALVLLANPLGMHNRPIYSNFTFEGNTTLQQAYINSEHVLVTQNVSFEGASCPFRLVFQMQPVPIAANKIILEGVEQEERFEMAGVFMSAPKCKTAIDIKAASAPLKEFYAKLKKYVIMISAASFVQIFVLIKQMEYTGTQAGATKVSLLTVGSQAVLDSYLCLIHLTVGILTDEMFGAFATAAFFQFVTFSLFEMRYLLIILKARRPQAFAEGWESLRREFSMFYLRFYSLLVAGFVVIFYWSAMLNVFIVLIYSFWIPQIIINAQRCTRRALMWEYILGMSASRLAVPLYFFGCSHNFAKLEPSPNMAMFLAAYVSLQVLVLYLQEAIGPQFFVPKWLMPHKYDYQRPLYAHLSEDQRNCVICMCEVEFSDRNHMITPCDHIFHGRCLMQWLDFKEECPTCRRALPPV